MRHTTQFILLDAKGAAIQNMRSTTYVQPGEVTACIGCHEPTTMAPPGYQHLPLAFRRRPKIEPGPLGGAPFSYVRFVQPVWDKHCVFCHNDKKAEGKVNLSGSPDGKSPPRSGRGREIRAIEHEVARNNRGKAETMTRQTALSSTMLGALFVLGQTLTTADLHGADRPAKSPGLPDPQRVYTDAEAIQIGWPTMAGPYGNYSPLRTETPIVDDASQIKTVWTTEGLRLGNCKVGTFFGKAMGSGKSIEPYLGQSAKTHPGSWSSLIVGGGKVFGASFRPSGDFVEVEFPNKTKCKVRVEAEDFVVAVDFNTGKKVWEAVEPGSILRGGGKRLAHQVTPVYARGKVFAMGATGRVFAYDAASGKKLWQTDIGPAFQQAEEARKKTLATLAGGTFAFGMEGIYSWHSSMVAAEHVLVVPTFPRETFDALPFRGLDMDNGKLLWEKDGVTYNRATPSVWRNGGREYLLAANTNGDMMLLNPADGKDLWKVTGLGTNGFTVTLSDTYALVNAKLEAKLKKGLQRVAGSFGAYRLSPAKAELAWRMPEDPKYAMSVWFDTIANHQETIRDGKAYFWSTESGGFFIVKIDTGEVIAEYLDKGNPCGGQCWYLVGDKIISRYNATHANMGDAPWQLFSVAGDTFRPLPGRFNPPHVAGTYEVVQQTPIVAGRMFERTQSGEISCYDLRAGRK